MNTLRYSPEALNDLDEIWAYIHNELHNPAAAKKTVLSILDTVEKLRDFSELGASLTAIMPVDSDYRYLICGKYIAFYRNEDVFVSIDRILYGKRDYLRVLFGNSIAESENPEQT